MTAEAVFCGGCGHKVGQAVDLSDNSALVVATNSGEVEQLTPVIQAQQDAVQSEPSQASIPPTNNNQVHIAQPLAVAAPPAKKSRKPLIILAAVVILIGLGVGGFFLLGLIVSDDVASTTARGESDRNSHIDDDRRNDGNMPEEDFSYQERPDYTTAETTMPPAPAPDDGPAPAQWSEAELATDSHLAIQGISHYGRIVAEEFLMQIPTIFANWHDPWFSGWEMEVGEQRFFGVPRLYFHEIGDGLFHGGWDENWQTIITEERVFQLGVEGYERVYHQWGSWVSTRPILTVEVPDVYLRIFRDEWERTGYYDRYGNRLEDAPWFLDSLYATGFSLWDFDGNGIPSIQVYYWGHMEGSGDGGPPTVLFRYVDGEFRRVYRYRYEGSPWGHYMTAEDFANAIANAEPTAWWFPWQEYHMNGSNLVGYFFGISESAPIYALIEFDGNMARKRTIANAVPDWENFDWTQSYSPTFYWTNNFTGESGFEAPIHDPWQANAHTSRYIPGSGMMLITRISPLEQLYDVITESIRSQLSK